MIQVICLLLCVASYFKIKIIATTKIAILPIVDRLKKLRYCNAKATNKTIPKVLCSIAIDFAISRQSLGRSPTILLLQQVLIEDVSSPRL